jgi:hypothetical protein
MGIPLAPILSLLGPGGVALLGMAAERDRILVAIGTDFGTSIFRGGATHAGVIRLPDVPASSRILLMEQILSRYAESDLAGAIVTVSGTHIPFSRPQAQAMRARRGIRPGWTPDPTPCTNRAEKSGRTGWRTRWFSTRMSA